MIILRQFFGKEKPAPTFVIAVAEEIGSAIIHQIPEDGIAPTS